MRQIADDDQSLMELLRELTDAAVHTRSAVARAGGLTQHDMVALRHLSRRPIGPGELARLLGVSTAASTGIVDRLVARGHVVRRAHPVDRRRTEVVMTDSGRQEVLGHLRPMLSALQELEAGFDAEERAVVARYLRGATAALERVGRP